MKDTGNLESAGEEGHHRASRLKKQYGDDLLQSCPVNQDGSDGSTGRIQTDQTVPKAVFFSHLKVLTDEPTQ